MKIAIPVNGGTIDTEVCVSFGRAPFFMLHDTESNESTFMENPGAASSGGAGIKAAQVVVDQKVDALLTPRMGQNAADVISLAKIVMYQTKGDNILENLEALKNNELAVLNDIHAGFHNHGEN